MQLPGSGLMLLADRASSEGEGRAAAAPGKVGGRGFPQHCALLKGTPPVGSFSWLSSSQWTLIPTQEGVTQKFFKNSREG